MENNKRIIQVSQAAYDYLHDTIKDDEFYKSRGVVGLVDQLIFGKFTTSGRGSCSKKPVDKK